MKPLKSTKGLPKDAHGRFPDHVYCRENVGQNLSNMLNTQQIPVEIGIAILKGLAGGIADAGALAVFEGGAKGFEMCLDDISNVFYDNKTTKLEVMDGARCLLENMGVDGYEKPTIH